MLFWLYDNSVTPMEKVIAQTTTPGKTGYGVSLRTMTATQKNMKIIKNIKVI